MMFKGSPGQTNGAIRIAVRPETAISVLDIPIAMGEN